MAEKTSILGLTKPVSTEQYELQVWNENSNILDNAIGNLRTSVNTAQSTAITANTRASNAWGAANNAVLNISNFLDSMDGRGNFPLRSYQNIALGSNVSINRANGGWTYPSIVIGHNSITTAGGTITLGIYAKTHSENAIAIGTNANGSGIESTALGNAASASWESLAAGSRTVATGRGASAIGHNAQSYGNYSTALGYGAYTAYSQPNVIQLGGNSISELRCLRSLTVTSDERDKTDIVNISKGLEFINSLEPIQYVSNLRSHYIEKEKQTIDIIDEETGEVIDTKETEALSENNQKNLEKYGLCEYNRAAHAAGLLKGERKRVGLKAQNIQQALEQIYGTTNYANIVNDNFYDLTETPPEGVESQLSVAYDIIIPFLIDAVKTLNKEFNELKELLNGK